MDPKQKPNPDSRVPRESGKETDNTELIRRILKQDEIFKEILDNLTNIAKHGATSPVPSGIYYNTGQTVINNATPDPPAGQVIDPSGVTVLGTLNYQTELVHNTLQRNAPIIGVINDGTTIIYVVSTQDAHTWSSETPILPGEGGYFYNVWALGLRSPAAGNRTTGQGGIYRVKEYGFWLVASNVNRSAFTAQSVQPINNLPAFTNLPNIYVPKGFPLVVRATVGNANSVYLANSAANLAIAANRITLNAGDVAKLNITNANLVFVAGSGAGVNNVDLLVEQ